MDYADSLATDSVTGQMAESRGHTALSALIPLPSYLFSVSFFP